jgi:zinc transport system substrate-binding protein
MRRMAVTLALSLLAACGTSGAEGDAGEPTVVASFYPLAFVADLVGGPAAEVVNLTAPGAEAHDVEPTASQVVEISEADVVLYLGGGFQPSIENLAADVGDAALDVSGTQSLRPATGEADEAFDPHLWLDPTRLIPVAEAVSERLAGVDPDDTATYRRGSRELVHDLRSLDRDFKDGLAKCDSREIVTSHEAFGYLAERYGLEQIGIAGLDPEAEPSPQRIAEVSDFVREHEVTTIFFETLVSPEIAQTIAQETGARTAMLDPLEGPPEEGDYLTAMRANLDTLREALRCR